jgi:hypothetical protein
VSGLRLPQLRIEHAAYVTRDLERGMARLTAMFGVGNFTVYPEMAIPTPQGEALITFAMGAVNGMPLEVIEPRGANDEVFRQCLPNDPDDIRLHHYASAVKSEYEWKMVLDAVDNHGFATPVRGENPAYGMTWTYLDTRRQLGHMLEFIWHDEAAGRSWKAS